MSDRTRTADGKEVKDGDRVWIANQDGSVEDGVAMMIVSCECGYEGTCQTYSTKEAARIAAYQKKKEAEDRWESQEKKSVNRLE